MRESLKAEVNLYGEVIIYSASGEILHRARPDGYTAQKVGVLNGGSAVVLLKFSEKKHGSFENLLLLNSEGRLIWRAQLPDPSSGDAYVDFDIRENRLFANSWSCYLVEIDVESGKILHREFTK